jgi:signal transduction histidine kinase/CheY-like chemotaxis protein
LLNLLILLLSVLIQATAAGLSFRIYRTSGRPKAWLMMSIALILMASRRLYVLGDLWGAGFPQTLVGNEVIGLVISVLMLAGITLIRDTFLSMVDQARSLEEARSLAQAEADKLASLMAATPIPLWIAEDPDCQVVRGNKAADDLLRVSGTDSFEQTFLGRPESHFRFVQGGKELAADELLIERAARLGLEFRGEAVDLVFTDGTIRHLTAYASPLRDAAGVVHGAVCCMVDITEVRRVEEALARAQKMESLGMLSGGIAHDFNNIFQSMVANLEMAQAALSEGSRARPYLHRLETGLGRASRLSRDILHSSGGDLRRPESVELSPLVAEALDRSGVPVSRELEEHLPAVLVDPRLVGRIVEGLVTNAAEANSPKGILRVRAYLRTVTALDLATGHWPEPVDLGSYVVLEVSDQGQGIDAATLPKIFDPFFSTRDLGRGLGLAAALGIARGHRGGIQVESILGVGSVFRVHFPTPEGQESIPSLPVEGGPSRNLVLLADDEDELRAVLAEMLEDWFGLEVVGVSDGQEALEVFSLRPEAFDLVILDATMPRMGGVEAFERMKALRPTLQGLLCSGYALPASRDQAQAQGFADFLKKPFTSAELETILNRLLGIRMK